MSTTVVDVVQSLRLGLRYIWLCFTKKDTVMKITVTQVTLQRFYISTGQKTKLKNEHNVSGSHIVPL